VSLLVYSEGALYGDRCYIINEGTSTQTKSFKTKLYFDTPRTSAVACIGEEPGFGSKDFQLIIDVIAARCHSAQAGEEVNVDSKKIIKRMFAGGHGSYLVMTKTDAYVVTECSVIRLPEGEDFAIGTGDVCFWVCRHAGLSVEDSYAQVAKIILTMGGPLDKITREELVDIKLVAIDAPSPIVPALKRRKKT
jgi:hypothetical protein